MNGVWVFGYGSLVSPSSFSATIGRELQPGVDFFAAEVAGLGRRWNYGVLHSSASGPGPDGTMVDYTLVALGVVDAADETVNGVVGWVAADELELLDHRERHYDRLDVTDGTANTPLLGEKALDPRGYNTGGWYHNEPIFSGGSDGTARRGASVDRDASGDDFQWNWGAAHPAGALFAFADGSVRVIRFGTTEATLAALLTPAGGEVVNVED